MFDHSHVSPNSSRTGRSKLQRQELLRGMAAGTVEASGSVGVLDFVRQATMDVGQKTATPYGILVNGNKD